MRYRICIYFAWIFALFAMQSSAYAALELELTQGVNGAIPIAIVPFAGQSPQDTSPQNVAHVIQADLQNSGRFNVLSPSQIQKLPTEITQINGNDWQSTGVDNVVIGRIAQIGVDKYEVSFALVDVLKAEGQGSNNVLVQDKFIVPGKQLRKAGHRISDIIYQQLTGEKGFFSTSIAYVVVERYINHPSKHMLEVADFDGFNPRPLLVSPDPIMSPTWSPDGRSVAYVSFENRRAAIYLQDVATGKRTLLTSFPGINGAPAWSPDGSQLAFVLSKGGAPNIYTFNLRTRSLNQATNGVSIDTEPSWSPDGQSIIFTSNRGGGPQVYQLFLGTGKIQRLTFEGNYNASASFTKDGKNIVLLHGDGNHYNVAVQDLANGAIKTLTHAGNASSPSVAPNSRMVLYAKNEGGKGELGIVSIDGKVHIRIPAPEGAVQAPSWSPFL